LARISNIFFMVEGGPGTVDEAQQAKSCGAIVIPIFSTGGASSGMFGFDSEAAKRELTAEEVTALSDPKLAPQEVANCAIEIIKRIAI